MRWSYAAVAAVPLAVFGAVVVAAPRPKVPVQPLWTQVSLRVDQASLRAICKAQCHAGSTLPGRGVISTLETEPWEAVPRTRSTASREELEERLREVGAK